MKKFLRHYFTPHSKNNHRAKLLHHQTLLAVVATFFVATFFVHSFSTSAPSVLGISYSINASDLFSITNKDRADNGLAPLTLNTDLNNAAAGKAEDMFTKDYWAHFAPDGSTTPWMFIKNAGYDYLYAGENLAKGFTSSSDVVTAWMNSPSHRENMLSPKYKDIGFAVKEGTLQGEDTVLVVEMFGSPQSAIADVSDTGTQTSAAAPQSVPVQVAEQATQHTPLISPVPSQTSHPEVKPLATEAVQTSPVLNLKMTTKSILIIVLSVFIFTFLLDMMIVEKRKIPRIVGHNLDHILLIAVFLLFVILSQTGGIL